MITIVHREELQRRDNCLCLQELEKKNHCQDVSTTADEQRIESYTVGGKWSSVEQIRGGTHARAEAEKEGTTTADRDGSTPEAERRAAGRSSRSRRETALARRS